MEQLIISVLITIAPYYNIDPHLAAAVIKTESNFNPQAIGTIGELGLFQIRPEFSKYSKLQLLDWKTNITAGLENLANSKTFCKHKVDNTFVICHNSGITGAKKIKNPFGQSYYKKVSKIYLTYTGL